MIDRAFPAPSDGRSVVETLVDLDRFAILRRTFENEGNRVVVSFGGGGLSGFCGNLALVGFLEALGLRRFVREIWGTSAGAIVGASWATGMEIDQMLPIVRSLEKRRILDIGWTRLARGVLLRTFGGGTPDGLLRGRRLRAMIDEGLLVKTFEECPIPFRCIAASDDGRSQRKILHEGRLLPAIYSSLALPGLFMPWPGARGEAGCYQDGGLVEKTPLLSPIREHQKCGDPRRLVLLATHFADESPRRRATGFLSRFVSALFALQELVWQYQLREAREHENLLLVVVNPHLDEGSLFEVSRIPRLYLAGRMAIAEQLQDSNLSMSFGRV
jgi:NTE family protein